MHYVMILLYSCLLSGAKCSLHLKAVEDEQSRLTSVDEVLLQHPVVDLLYMKSIIM